MNSRCAGFEILTVLLMDESIFRVVMSYSWMKILRNMPLRLQTVRLNQARKWEEAGSKSNTAELMSIPHTIMIARHKC